ncbi:MAG: O-antigen ligase family protein [Burkholderiales bacterium]|jgi:O-antigen ligase|nr:O-antigen ligase family protein [Betaproteobacteria bacterium]
MTTSRTSINQPDRRAVLLQVPMLLGIANSLVCLGLLVAPFRSSAGLRAACFVFSFLILAFIWGKTRTFSINLPQGTLLRAGVLIWVGTVFLYCLGSGDVITSLESWRGDVLTPVLAGLVCYNLCLTRQQLKPILLSLLVGLLILAGMVVVDPFQPLIGTHEPRYVNVGWLSTWVVLLASLLPLAWLVKWPRPSLAYAFCLIALAALVVAAWFSANRIVWLCLGLMFGLYVVFNGRVAQSLFVRLALLVGGAVVAGFLFYLASTQRANAFPDAGVNGITIVQQDDRLTIWREALNTIKDRPFVGHGYALEEAKTALAERFTEPGFRVVFRQAHNVVLNHAIQIGIPGAISLLLLFAGLAHAFWQRRDVSAGAAAIATCGLMLVAGFFLRNMTDDFFSRHAVLLFGALVGLLLAVCDWQDERHEI